MGTRVCVIADMHCGHRAGLTPPGWQWSVNADPSVAKWAVMQQDMWIDYLDMLKLWKPIEILIINGDCIDGEGTRSGGTELITSDREKQANMAAECINEVGANTIVMTYGTPYHVGAAEDWENIVAANVDAYKIENEGRYDIEGKVFNCRHFISSSIIPHGRQTALNRDKLWGWIWSEMYGQPKADVTIRSHVHYFAQSNDTALGFGIITPALQGPSTKWGARFCQGWVDFGLVVFDVEKGEDIQCHVERRLVSVTSQEPLKLTE